MGENYYGGGKGLYEEPIPPFTRIRVALLTQEDVFNISEQFRKLAVYHAKTSDTFLIAGKHARDEFDFLGADRVIDWKNFKGWPEDFPRIIIPPSQRGLNLTPFNR